jgi:hypothetical protein
MDVHVPRALLYALGALVLVGAGVGITLAITGGDDDDETVTVSTVTEAASEDEPPIETTTAEEIEGVDPENTAMRWASTRRS